MENEVMMNEVMEEAVETATASAGGLKKVTAVNIATGAAILAGVGVLAYKGAKKLYSWGKAKIEAKRAADAACAETTNSTDIQTVE